jgi:hypothetical protein
MKLSSAIESFLAKIDPFTHTYPGADLTAKFVYWGLHPPVLHCHLEETYLQLSLKRISILSPVVNLKTAFPNPLARAGGG